MRFPRHFSRWIPVAALVLAAGCSGDTGDQPAAGADPAEMVEASFFDATLFDSISWSSSRDARNRGATVYAYSCAKCHGANGAGDGGHRIEGRLVRPPSFLDMDWRFAEDPDGLRQAIHTGNDGRMPHWGRAGLSPRDVDAVAEYIREELWAKAY